MKGTVDGPDEWQFERFLASQTIQMALEGIPAFYIHSLLGTGNDYEGVERTGQNRTINRKRWDYPELRAIWRIRPRSMRACSRDEERIRIRARQPAFHPNATQFTLHLGEKLFGFWRQSLDRDQSIFAIHNVTKEEVTIPAMAINLITGMKWTDLLSGEAIDPSRGEITFAPYQCRWISNRIGGYADGAKSVLVIRYFRGPGLRRRARDAGADRKTGQHGASLRWILHGNLSALFYPRGQSHFFTARASRRCPPPTAATVRKSSAASAEAGC
jgi:hypothetical protein